MLLGSNQLGSHRLGHRDHRIRKRHDESCGERKCIRRREAEDYLREGAAEEPEQEDGFAAIRVGECTQVVVGEQVAQLVRAHEKAGVESELPLVFGHPEVAHHEGRVREDVGDGDGIHADAETQRTQRPSPPPPAADRCDADGEGHFALQSSAIF